MQRVDTVAAIRFSIGDPHPGMAPTAQRWPTNPVDGPNEEGEYGSGSNGAPQPMLWNIGPCFPIAS